MPSILSTLESRLSRRTSGRDLIPEIDGLRSVAILSVVIMHAAAAYFARTGRVSDGTTLDRELTRIISSGEYGVPMFFAISGFILALPFAQHRIDGARRPSIKRYFTRRITRLEPPYLLFLCVRLAIALARGAGIAVLPHFLASCIYSHALIYGEPPEIGFIAWSLEVEVQFYVLAPLLTLVFAIPARAARIAILATAMLAFSWFFGVSKPMTGLYIHNHAAYFLAGLLLADLYLAHLRDDAPNRPRSGPFWDAAALLAIPAIFIVKAYELAPHLLAPWLILIAYYAVFRATFTRRLFRWKPVVILGGMCYSTYLWHFTAISVIAAIAFRFLPPEPSWPMRIAFTLAASVPALLVGAIMFALVERPTMNPRWPQELWSRIRRTRRRPEAQA